MTRVLVGHVMRAHGLRGALRIHCDSGDPTLTARSLMKAGVLHLGEEERTVTRSRAEKEDILIELDGIADRDTAEAQRGKTIMVERDALPPPDPNEVYLNDLVGCTVVTPADVTIGTIAGSYHSGAQDVLIVHSDKGERLLPFVEPMLVEVDLAARRVVYDAPPGLIDDDVA